MSWFCCQRQENVFDGEHSRRDRRRTDKTHGDERDPGVFTFTHIDQERGRDRQGDRRQQLIASSKHRPDGRDTSGIDQIGPAENDQQAGNDVAGQRCAVTERLVNLPNEFLQHIAGDARAGIDRGQNKQRFKHDGVVIPIAHQAIHAGKSAENLGHADGE